MRCSLDAGVASSGCSASMRSTAAMNASPVAKRWFGSFAISPSISGCNTATRSGSFGTGSVTCISATA